MYPEIKQICILVTAVSTFLAAVFIIGELSMRQAAAQVLSTEFAVPMDDFEKLEPRRHWAKQEPNGSTYRFVVYFDSSHCSSCELKGLASWNEMIARAKEYGVAIDFLFIFSPNRGTAEEFRQSYAVSHFFQTVYIDAEGSMLKMNPLMTKLPGLRFFILDDSGKVCFTGNPCQDSTSYERYIDFLQKVS